MTKIKSIYLTYYSNLSNLINIPVLSEMKTTKNIKNEVHGVFPLREEKKAVSGINEIAKAFAELEQAIHATLEVYSNIHRGSGHNSMVSTYLFEHARNIVLEYLGLNKSRYVVIFCTPKRETALKKQLKPGSYQIVSSLEIGLRLGVRALAVKRKTLPRGTPFLAGGGTAKLISKDWVIWAEAPDKFEAGTPAIVNVIAFAKALLLIRKFGNDIFQNSITEKLSTTEILYNDELEKYSGRKLLDQLKHILIGRNIHVPTMKGDRAYIHLDNSASTPTFDPIWNAFRQTWCQPETIQHQVIQEVRSIVAGFLGAPLSEYDVIFTSNTTEAINLVAESLSRESEDGSDAVVLNTLLEHNSNDLPWRQVPGYSLERLSVNPEGFMDLKELETLLNAYNRNDQYGKKRIKLVAVSGASNVLGVCNDLDEISKIVRQYGAHFLVDAAQLVAHRQINMKASGIDYLAFSAHKVYAPFGCGVLVVRKGLLNFDSAELELIKSSGEENAGGIAALGKAFVLLQRIGMDLIKEEEETLTRRLLNELSQIRGLKIYGINHPDSPKFFQKIGVVVFSHKSILPGRIAKELAMQSGIGVRYGCHCAHIIVKRLLNISPLLERFQSLIQTLFPRLKLPGLVRVSLGLENSEEDVEKFIHTLSEITKQPQSTADKQSFSTENETRRLSKADVKKQIKDFISASAMKVYSHAKN